ncbi:MAG: deoxyguanosinetriphosphate triphosphohydrolase [Chloroflexia bacterium]|jgi:dGTPase|nr:deoxyguanosinetriphosphate triphosphohydrolase [Chloroflexia bacterium]MDQ3614248.1 deoxyguanosinetriphosphate triphosphohydrolase [Chloroflexota bacterium]
MVTTTATSDSSIRAMLERFEDDRLVPLATRSNQATRPVEEDESPVRMAFQRDRDRIIHSKSFRRLMHKTQVFIAPGGDHYRTRLTHTLEVAQLARTVGRALRLNEDLVEAIGMGHDLGHTPFGHAGERALAEVFPNFRHNEQSLRVVDILEKDGAGLNLTNEVRDGILRHSKPRESIEGAVSGHPSTLEGMVIKVVDSIAYMNHDLDDAIRSGLLSYASIPSRITERLGDTHPTRINSLILDLIDHSQVEQPPASIELSPEMRQTANELRGFLFERVYDPINQRDQTREARDIVLALFDWFTQHPEEIPATIPELPGESLDRRAADSVATMTDRYALELHRRIAPHQVLVP